MNKIVTFTFFIVLLFISAASVQAQDCDPNLDPNCETNPDIVPLDSGVGILLGVAVFYGFTRLKKAHNEANSL